MTQLFNIGTTARKLPVYAALPVALALMAPVTAHAEMSSEELVKALQSGGYVVYLRHTKTQKGQEDLDHKNLSNCTTQRNLSKAGREQAKVIGRAFKTLGIKVDTVRTSPYCRAKDTAKIAFGGGKNSGPLRYMSHIPESERPAAIRSVRSMLGARPPRGTNTILISHTENLKQVAKIWPRVSGVAHVFKPEGNGSYTHLGKIDPGEWTQLASAAGSSGGKSCFWGMCW